MRRPPHRTARAALGVLGVLAAAAASVCGRCAVPKARGRPATAMAVVLACLVSHAAAAASPLPLGAAAAASSPPDPNVNDTIVSNATALRAAIEDGHARRIPLTLHVVGRIALGEAGFMFGPDTFLWVRDGQLVTLWSEEGEGTLDAEGGGRVFWVRPPPLRPRARPPAARPCAAAAP